MKTKILYVEDEPFLGKIVMETLESQEYDVLLVNDGAEVMQSFEMFTPDICVLDVMLPNVDGFTIGETIRQQSPHLPIIFLTAKVETDDLIKGFKHGGTDYIRKPFSTKELIVRIENQLTIASALYPASVSGEEAIGDYFYHSNKYELCLNGTVLKLSSREVEILNLLLKHRNTVVERKSLLMSVWGDDSYYNSRNLDVYIRKLRRYFAEDSRIEIITLKGKGYHFIVP